MVQSDLQYRIAFFHNLVALAVFIVGCCGVWMNVILSKTGAVPQGGGLLNASGDFIMPSAMPALDQYGSIGPFRYCANYDTDSCTNIGADCMFDANIASSTINWNVQVTGCTQIKFMKAFAIMCAASSGIAMFCLVIGLNFLRRLSCLFSLISFGSGVAGIILWIIMWGNYRNYYNEGPMYGWVLFIVGTITSMFAVIHNMIGIMSKDTEEVPPNKVYMNWYYAVSTVCLYFAIYGTAFIVAAILSQWNWYPSLQAGTSISTQAQPFNSGLWQVCYTDWDTTCVHFNADCLAVAYDSLGYTTFGINYNNINRCMMFYAWVVMIFLGCVFSVLGVPMLYLMYLDQRKTYTNEFISFIIFGIAFAVSLTGWVLNVYMRSQYRSLIGMFVQPTAIMPLYGDCLGLIAWIFLLAKQCLTLANFVLLKWDHEANEEKITYVMEGEEEMKTIEKDVPVAAAGPSEEELARQRAEEEEERRRQEEEEEARRRAEEEDEARRRAEEEERQRAEEERRRQEAEERRRQAEEEERRRQEEEERRRQEAEEAARKKAEEDRLAQIALGESLMQQKSDSNKFSFLRGVESRVFSADEFRRREDEQAAGKDVPMGAAGTVLGGKHSSHDLGLSHSHSQPTSPSAAPAEHTSAVEAGTPVLADEETAPAAEEPTPSAEEAALAAEEPTPATEAETPSAPTVGADGFSLPVPVTPEVSAMTVQCREDCEATGERQFDKFEPILYSSKDSTYRVKIAVGAGDYIHIAFGAGAGGEGPSLEEYVEGCTEDSPLEFENLE